MYGHLRAEPIHSVLSTVSVPPMRSSLLLRGLYSLLGAHPPPHVLTSHQREQHSIAPPDDILPRRDQERFHGLSYRLQSLTERGIRQHAGPHRLIVPAPLRAPDRAWFRYLGSVHRVDQDPEQLVQMPGRTGQLRDSRSPVRVLLGRSVAQCVIVVSGHLL